MLLEHRPGISRRILTCDTITLALPLLDLDLLGVLVALSESYNCWFGDFSTARITIPGSRVHSIGEEFLQRCNILLASWTKETSGWAWRRIPPRFRVGSSQGAYGMGIEAMNGHFDSTFTPLLHDSLQLDELLEAHIRNAIGVLFLQKDPTQCEDCLIMFQKCLEV